MGQYDFDKMAKKLSRYLDKARYKHTIGVMHTSVCLAMAHGADMEAAQLAGLLHDSAKCIPNKKKLKLCRQHKIPVTPFEEKHPFLLHSKLGAYLAKEKYDVKDEAVLDAITYHTTGKPEMSRLAKITYIADYIEPLRDKAPNLAAVRKLAFADLDECMYVILKDTLCYLNANPADIEPLTWKAYTYYEKLHNAKQKEMKST